MSSILNFSYSDLLLSLDSYHRYSQEVKKLNSLLLEEVNKEKVIWNNAKEDNMSYLCKEYITVYPNGSFIEEAKDKYKQEIEVENKLRKFMEWGKENDIRIRGGINSDYGFTIDDFYSKTYKENAHFIMLKKLTNLEINFHDYNTTKDSFYIPSEFTCLENLRILNFKFLPEYIETIPDWISNLNKLKSIHFHASYIKKLPYSIGNINTLENINIRHNENEIEYPKSIISLKNLKTITYTGSNNSLEILSQMYQIEDLNIYKTDNFDFSNSVFLNNLKSITFSRNGWNTFLPEWIKKCKNLESLHISNNNIALPEWIGEIKSLKKISGYESHRLEELPNSIGDLINLEDIYFNRCLNLKLPESIGNLVNLKNIYLGRFCEEYLPESIIKLKQLEHFEFNINLYEEFNEKLIHYKYISKEINDFIISIQKKDIEYYGHSIHDIQKAILEYNKKLRVEDDKLWNYDHSSYLDCCPSNGYYIEEANEKNLVNSIFLNPTIEAYQNYIKVFPNGKKVIEFKEKILWNEVLRTNTEESYENYLTKFPDGLYSEKAKNKIKFLSNSLVRIWKYLY